MSIDKIHLVDVGRRNGDGPNYEVTSPEVVEELRANLDEYPNTVYVMRAGVEHLFVYDNPVKAVADFEAWRREPCERITLKLYDVLFMNEGRLPLRD